MSSNFSSPLFSVSGIQMSQIPKVRPSDTDPQFSFLFVFQYGQFVFQCDHFLGCAERIKSTDKPIEGICYVLLGVFPSSISIWLS